MKVLFVYKFLTLGGCETVLRARLDGLSAHGIEPEAWFFHDGGGRSIFAGVEEKIHVGSPDEFAAHAAAGGFDVVSTLDSEEVFPFFGAEGLRCRLVVEAHTPYLENLEYLRPLASRGVPVTAFWVPSRYQAGLVRERTGRGCPVDVVPNPLRDAFVAPPAGFVPAPPRPVVAWVGRLDALKNWAGFLEVAGALMRRGIDAEYWIIGRPYDKEVDAEVFRRAKAEGVAGRLRWFRGVRHDRIPVFMDAVRASGGAVVSTSKGDSFGMTVAEAMARSAIVLAPRWGPFPEFVADGETGFLYEPGSAADAARHLETALGDAGLRERTGAAARNSVLARFAPRAALASLEEALRRVAVSPVPDVVPPPVSTEAAPPRGEVDDEFASAIRKYFGSEYLAHEPGRAEVRDEWIRYALSTNDRGEALLGSLSSLLGVKQWRGRRVLDIGCGYGGLVRAAVRAGAVAVGVDDDPKLVEIARVNLRDEPPSSWRLVAAPVEACDLEAGGPFDLVVADNVLEHVDDPRSVVDRLARSLAKGGSLYVAVPNPFSPPQVLKDPHFGLFGLTLLSPDDARRVFAEAGWGGATYSVGRYATAEEYFSWLQEAGLDSRFAIRTTWWGEVFSPEESFLVGLEAQSAQVSLRLAEEGRNEKLSPATRAALQRSVEAWKETLRQDVAAARSGGGTEVLERIAEWYGPLVWHFLATKSGRTPATRPPTLRHPR